MKSLLVVLIVLAVCQSHVISDCRVKVEYSCTEKNGHKDTCKFKKTYSDCKHLSRCVRDRIITTTIKCKNGTKKCATKDEIETYDSVKRYRCY